MKHHIILMQKYSYTIYAIMICITGESEEAETTTFSAVHDDIIQAHILTRLDGAALASAASTCSQLNSLSVPMNIYGPTCATPSSHPPTLNVFNK